METLDSLLYKWITEANKHLDDFALPVGFVEESIALITRVLGREYLDTLLVSESDPVHFLDDEANPLRVWLLSARVDKHVVQVLELAAYFRAFERDPALADKVEKLKRDKFWPIFFELAMATRVKRACRDAQGVSLNPENETSIGDFTLSIPGYQIPCECSRLGRSPQLTEPSALNESLSNRISDATKRISTALCIKIRSSKPLTGATYNSVLQLLRKSFADLRRSKLSTVHSDGSTTVTIEELTDKSEQIPFKYVDGRVVDVAGSDWDSASRLCRVPARNDDELLDRYDQGERFHEYEAVRVFTKFAAPVEEGDPYARLTTKLKKKLKQTKTTADHFGKIVFVEVPFAFQTVDSGKLRKAVRDAAFNSRTALGIVLTHREANPQIRHAYSQFGNYNRTAVEMKPEVGELFARLAKQEIEIDPVLGLPYRRTWDEAREYLRKLSAEITPD